MTEDLKKDYDALPQSTRNKTTTIKHLCDLSQHYPVDQEEVTQMFDCDDFVARTLRKGVIIFPEVLGRR